jgi:HEAT repeat protein
MSRLTWALLALALPITAVAGEHQAAVMDLLNAVEQPPTKTDLEAISDGVDAELMEIADDTEVASTRRGRAISALGFFPTDTVRAFLDAKLIEAGKSLFRRKAAYALAAGWGAESVEAIAAVLTDDDVQLRIAAVNALAQVNDATARQALETQLATESESAVKDAIEKGLKQEVAQ